MNGPRARLGASRQPHDSSSSSSISRLKRPETPPWITRTAPSITVASGMNAKTSAKRSAIVDACFVWPYLANSSSMKPYSYLESHASVHSTPASRAAFFASSLVTRSGNAVIEAADPIECTHSCLGSRRRRALFQLGLHSIND